MPRFAAVLRDAFAALGRLGASSSTGSGSIAGLLNSALGRKPSAGVHVDPDVALTYTAVWRAVNFISDMLACIPWHVYERSAGGREALEEHPLDYVLNVQPNEEMDAFTFRKLQTVNLLLMGNFYAEIVRSAGGDVVALWPIATPSVTVKRTKAGALYYAALNPETHAEVEFAPEDIYHPRGMSPDGLVGYGPITMAREAVSMGLAAQYHGAAFFGNDARPSFALSHPKTLTDKAKKNLQQSLAANYGGARRSWLPMLLEEDMKIETISIPNKDAQWLESRHFQIDEVARLFGLPPHKLMELSRSSFNNIESQERQVVTDALMPWAKAAEAQADWKLLRRAERGPNGRRTYTKLNLNALVRGDMTTRARFYEVMWRLGAYNTDEIRALEDLNPVDFGDQRFVMMNMQTLEQAANGEPAPASTPGATDDETDAPAAERAAAAQFITVQSILDRLAHAEANAAARRWGSKATDGWDDWIDAFHAQHRERLIEQLGPAAESVAMFMRNPAGLVVARQSVERFADDYLERSRAELENGAEGLDPSARATEEARDLLEQLVEALTHV